MIKKLAPIVAKDAYADPIERELQLYLLETIFAPLFDMLEEAGIQVDRRDQAIGRTPDLKNGTDWTIFPHACRSLRLKRLEMPQISQADREGLDHWLGRRSITSERRWMAPADLRPAQEGYWPEKVEEARAHEGEDRELLVSIDDFILDGHHQWFAAWEDQPTKRVPVRQYSAPIRGLIAAARTFPGTRFKNAAVDPVISALQANRIWYAAGRFSGKFSAPISRELRKLGATWDAKERQFSLPIERMPMALRTAIAQSEQASADLHKQISTVLTQMEQQLPQAAAGLHFKKAVDNIASDLQKQFVRTVPALESISVPVVITPGMRAEITTGLTENLQLYITKFAANEIPELRGLVEQNAFGGGRTPVLAQIIEARWGVSKRKAKFLAQQETSLLVSKYREQSYKRIGARRYMWSTALDERVRAEHRRLDGKIFSWDSAPPSGPHGEHQHPGEPFGCRCTAVPIVELPGVTVLP